MPQQSYDDTFEQYPPVPSAAQTFWVKTGLVAFAGACLLAFVSSFHPKNQPTASFLAIQSVRSPLNINRSSRPIMAARGVKPRMAASAFGRVESSDAVAGFMPPQASAALGAQLRGSVVPKAGAVVAATAAPRKFFVGGNWKCNGNLESIQTLVESFNGGESVEGKNVEVVLGPPFVYAQSTRQQLRKDWDVAVQNCWVGDGGAFTGEISADMIADLKFPWVILGHSERRLLPQLTESNEDVATKTAHALSKNLAVILCIGEQLEDREMEKTMDVVQAQLAAVAKVVDDWSKIVIAYEPVWAIGTGKVATVAQVQETHSQIRKWISDNVSPETAQAIRIIYGGSAKADNAPELSLLEDVDGFLVGGASLTPEFLEIVATYKNKE